MDIMELLKTRRTYRRFKQDPVPDSVVEDILTAARYASSAANKPVSYTHLLYTIQDCKDIMHPFLMYEIGANYNIAEDETTPVSYTHLKGKSQ